MYDLINSNVARLLETMNRSSDIDPYVWMIRELHEHDVSQHEEFQQEYCSYWALNGAGLGQPFRSAYFSLLEQVKSSPEQVTVEEITRTLYEIPINAKEKKALQFSFATKLVHMVNPSLPVYDRWVENFYFLPRSYTGTPEKKLANLLRSYRFLVREYDRILREGLIAPAIDELRRHFQLPPDYSDQKIIDTLIWKFVPFLKSGAVRAGSVVYRRNQTEATRRMGGGEENRNDIEFFQDASRHGGRIGGPASANVQSAEGQVEGNMNGGQGSIEDRRARAVGWLNDISK